MQNRYTGDVGDFSKYGLLKRLTGPNRGEGGVGFRLGVFWYLFPDEGATADGKHTAYLDGSRRNIERFRNCDPELYDQLKRIIDQGRRAIKSIQNDAVLPKGTVFHDRQLSFDEIPAHSPAGIRRREQHREGWLREGLEEIRSCHLIFADPDNGLENESTRPYRAKGPKYVSIDELRRLAAGGRGLVVYHHTDHRSSVADQVSYQMERLRRHLEPIEGVFAMSWHAFSVRVYFVIPGPGQSRTLVERARGMTEGAWGKHFRFWPAAI